MMRPSLPSPTVLGRTNEITVPPPAKRLSSVEFFVNETEPDAPLNVNAPSSNDMPLAVPPVAFTKRSATVVPVPE
jgi:hypothetical protein